MSNFKKHILVIRLSAMGDVAIAVPVLEALLKQNANLKITILTQKFFTPIFKNLKNTSVHAVETKGRHKGFFGLWKLYKELRINNYYAIVDLHNVVRSIVLKCFFFRKEFVQINKGRKEKRDLISKKSFKQLKSSHERYAIVFRKLGFIIDLSKPNFPEKEAIPAALKTFLNTNKKRIGIAPFATHKSKMYSLEKMKIVIEELSKNHSVLLFGSKNDLKLLENLKGNQNVFLVLGKFSFSEELDAISNLDCMISMDSGNAHLAAMYGIKVVTIWGVTHPFAGFTPFNQPKEYALLANSEKYPKIPTSVYGNKYPKEYLNAADSISPEKIIKKIKQLL